MNLFKKKVILKILFTLQIDQPNGLFQHYLFNKPGNGNTISFCLVYSHFFVGLKTLFCYNIWG